MIWETLVLALLTVRRNVLRSSLTILGIVIGVAAVIVMVTLGSGATAKVTNDISGLGSNVLHVRPGQGMRGPGGARADARALTVADAAAMANDIAGLTAVAPVAMANRQAIYRNTNWATSVTGATNAYLTVQGWELNEGQAFDRSQLIAGKAVCLLGQTVKKELFGDAAVLGKTIRLGKVSFKVIGTLKEKGQSGFGDDQDDVVIVPLRTLQRRMAGNDDIRMILVALQEGVDSQVVKEDIERLMRERREIRDGQPDDFHVRDMKELIEVLTGTTTVLTTLLGAVAAISLLVGGIGIMNIMMVSVTERTREIGTRLAIGAMAREVLMQFLAESVTLAALGGVMGIVLGIGAAIVGTRIIGVPFVFDPGIVAGAFLFSGAVGVVFGYFPARKAARLDPIEALRYE